MKNIIVGRQKQIAELKEAVASDKPEMVALVGRRRVGKTYLVRQVYVNDIDFELTGAQHQNMESQLQNFIFSMGKYFPSFHIKEKPTNWLEAFHLLSQAMEGKPKQRKMVIFLDELPWLGSKRSGFVSALGYFWNSWGSQQNLVLALCGSAASWMIKKVIEDKGGLHNRVTRLLFLYPFTLAETEEYCQKRGIKLNRHQILQIYMTFGGVPMYLDLLKPGLSAVQNIQAACFTQDGYLRNEFTRLYSSLFDNHEKHINIIRALASKHRGLTRQEIIGLTKFSNGGMLTELLDELEKSGFITIYSGFGKKVKESLYRLTDFYSLFYLTYIEPLGKHSKIEFTQLSDLPKWKIWSGYTYETVCITHINQIRRTLGISGIATSVSTFIAAPKDGLPGAQIDLIIERSDQSINLCEIKYSTSYYEVSKRDAEDFSSKKRVFQYHTKTNKHLFLTLITTVGVIENSQKINQVDQVVILDDLFSQA
jgi:uncharacterized protein